MEVTRAPRLLPPRSLSRECSFHAGNIAGNASRGGRGALAASGEALFLELAAASAQALLPDGARVATTAAVAGITHEGNGVDTASPAPLGAGRTTAGATRARLAEGAGVVAATAIVVIVHERNVADARPVAPGLGGLATRGAARSAWVTCAGGVGGASGSKRVRDVLALTGRAVLTKADADVAAGTAVLPVGIEVDAFCPAQGLPGLAGGDVFALAAEAHLSGLAGNTALATVAQITLTIDAGAAALTHALRALPGAIRRGLGGCRRGAQAGAGREGSLLSRVGPALGKGWKGKKNQDQDVLGQVAHSNLPPLPTYERPLYLTKLPANLGLTEPRHRGRALPVERSPYH